MRICTFLQKNLIKALQLAWRPWAENSATTNRTHITSSRDRTNTINFTPAQIRLVGSSQKYSW